MRDGEGRWAAGGLSRGCEGEEMRDERGEKKDSQRKGRERDKAEMVRGRISTLE